MIGRYCDAFDSEPEACSVTFWAGPFRLPTGVFELAAATALRISSMPMPIEASASGSAWTRTANFCPPKTWTWATPGSVEMRCAIITSAYSSTTESGSVSEARVRNITGWSAGLTFWKRGGVDVALEVELHGDRADALAARRDDRVESGDRRELSLERRRNRGGHGLRAGARQAGGDDDGREVDARQRRHRQQ